MPFRYSYSGRAQGSIKRTYNPAKDRWEWWARADAGDREWIFHNAFPARVWRDRFMVSPAFVAVALGLATEIPWSVNGRRNGANDPNAACFTPANEKGGGLVLNVVAGGQVGDYTAIHWGGNYPTILSTSPHWHIRYAWEQITLVASLHGLVDSSRSDAQAAFALPDNGIFVYYDTDVDNLVHYVIRSGGVSVTDVSCATPVAAAHRSVHMQTSDDGESVRLLEGGSAVMDWVDMSGAAYAGLRAAQLQPYIAVVNRAAAQLRQFHAHDSRLLMDRGFS